MQHFKLVRPYVRPISSKRMWYFETHKHCFEQMPSPRSDRNPKEVIFWKTEHLERIGKSSSDKTFQIDTHQQKLSLFVDWTANYKKRRVGTSWPKRKQWQLQFSMSTGKRLVYGFASWISTHRWDLVTGLVCGFGLQSCVCFIHELNS